MLVLTRFFYCLLLMTTVLFSSPIFANKSISIPILCYHNFNPTVPGSMTMTPKQFEAELKWLKDNGFAVIPLKDAVAYLQGKRTTLPPKPVVITADDGWKSVYTYMYPLAQKYNIPVTLFIYPQVISRGKSILTWKELKEMQQTGLFDIQSHTLSHPNFRRERKKRSRSNYKKFVNTQLIDSKKILEEKLGVKITLLAWPYGIHSNYLEKEAAKAGYVMAFSIGGRAANRKYSAMAQPRFMIVASQSMKTVASIVSSGLR